MKPVWLGGVLRDLRFALRIFRRQAGVTSVAIAGLAVSIGVVTAAFSLINAYSLRPLGVPDPGAVIHISRITTGVRDQVPFADYVQLREAARLVTFEGSIDARIVVSDAPDADGGAPVDVRFVSGSLVGTFGGRAILGRIIEPADDLPGAPPVVTLHYAFWQSRLRGDPRVVGRTLYFDDAPVTVVGVFDRDFSGPFEASSAASLLLPLAASRTVAPQIGPFDRAGAAPIQLVGRLRRPATIAQARAEVASIVAGLGWIRPATSARAASAVYLWAGSSPLTVQDFGQYAVLMVMVGLVLLLASANVANLLLAGATSRQQEIGARLALGATRGRIARQLMTESLLIGAIGGVAGLVMALCVTPVMASWIQLPPSLDVSPDVHVGLFVAFVSVVVGAAGGLTPARFAGRGDIAGAIKGGSPQTGHTPATFRMQSLVLGVQAAASMLLLVVTWLFGRGLVVASRPDVRFDGRGLILVTAPAPSSTGAIQTIPFWDAALARVRAWPGVQGAALVDDPPFDSAFHPIDAVLNGRRYPAVQNRSSPDYFSTAGFRMMRGRTYTPAEVASNAPVAVITARLAHDFWPGADALDSSLGRVARTLDDIRVIGIVADGPAMNGSSRYWGAGVVYRPAATLESPHPVQLVVRLADASGAQRRAIQAALAAIDPARRPRVSLVSEGLERLLRGPRLLASAAAIVGALALTLAMSGVVGVTAFVAGQRQREIAVRRAIGAGRSDILRLVMRQGMRPLVIGVVAGVGLSLMVVPIVPFFVLGAPVSGFDPVGFGVAATILIVAAAAAVLMPATRATRIDPAVVLREGS